MYIEQIKQLQLQNELLRKDLVGQTENMSRLEEELRDIRRTHVHVSIE